MARIVKGFSKQLVMSVTMAALLLIVFLATAGACSRTAAKLIEAKDRAVEYYEDVRLVYRIATRFKHLEAQNEAAERRSVRNDRNKRFAGSSNQAHAVRFTCGGIEI